MDQNATTAAASTGMTRAERRAAAALGGVFFLRMLGLFMVLPVLPLHAGAIPGATPLLAGLALGGWTWSTMNNRQLVANVEADLAQDG